MDKFFGTSLYIKNYKCFFDDPQGFDEIKPINIIIGRNNSGKSSLIELLEHAIQYRRALRSPRPDQRVTSFVFKRQLTESELKRSFPDGVRGGDIGGDHWLEFGASLVGATVTYEQFADRRQYLAIDRQLDKRSLRILTAHQKHLVDNTDNPFSELSFKRLYAERNVVPEDEGDSDEVHPDGRGFTNLVRRFINMDALPSELVEKILLRELNAIVSPDMLFTDLVVQQYQGTKQWEIYLEEEKKGRISVGNSGSGIKTILLALGLLHLIPYIEKKDVGQYLFALEELENNLHPALQRRLLLYLRVIAEKHHCVFMLTTHSPVFIDIFSADPMAQIIHVTHDGQRALVRTPKTYVHRKTILDDLDVRASDLLQSNCIVWVEGPSDRIYLNRWIELFTDGALKEGAHYQCVFYGGRLLAHLSAEQPEPSAIEDAVSILRVNRNAIVVIDSDRTKRRRDLNDTKKRLDQEVRAIGGFSWITAGKEIENYIPVSALERLFSKSGLPKLDKWADFGDYVDENIKAGDGQRFERRKVVFAEQVSEHLTKADLALTLDLEERIREMVAKIYSWNSMRAPSPA
jgi:putative ATP-dependent endonuclease of the OLD family